MMSAKFTDSLRTEMLQNDEKCSPITGNVLPNILNVDRSTSEHAEEIQEEIFKSTNMSMLCLKCCNYVKVANLEDHRSLHDALALFKYDFHARPVSEQALSRKRTVLLKDLSNIVNLSRSGYRKELRKIDLAYEIIKADIYGRSNKAKPSFIEEHDVIIWSARSKLQKNVALGVSMSTNEKWKSIMEDACDYRCDSSKGQAVAYFGVFDGYNGPTAAKECADQFYQILTETLNLGACIGDTDDHNLADGFQQAFDNMDKVLLYGANETSRNRWSGCSATTCLLGDKTLYVANVGNVKAVLVKDDGSYHALTEDHTPTNKKEKHRIKANGDVHKWSKTVWVNGVAMTTRGLGNHGDPILKSTILNVPSVCSVPLADGQIILVGSYGFWQVFNEREAILLVREWLEKNQVGAPGVNMSSDISNDSVSNASVKIVVQNENATKSGSPDVSDRSEEIENQYSQYWTLEKSGCSCASNSHEIGQSDGSWDIVDLAQLTKQKMVQIISLSKLLRTLVLRNDAAFVAVGISNHLTKAALTGGSKENITVLVVLPNDIGNVVSNDDELR